MTTSTNSASMDMRSLLARGDAAGPGPVRRGQDCDGTRQRQLAVKLLIRPTSPAGPVPAAAGGQVRRKARKPVSRRVTPTAADGQPITDALTWPGSQSVEC